MKNAVHAEPDLSRPGYSQLGERITPWQAVRETLSPVNGYPGTASFYMSFPRFAMAQSSLGVLPYIAAVALAPPAIRLAFGVLLLAKLSLGNVLGAALVSRLYPILVCPEGIRARNAAGIAYRLRWEEIAEVRLLPSLFTSRYARIDSFRKKHAIWLPLFLTDMPGFTALVSEFAPVDNPLRQFLEAQACRQEMDTATALS